MVSTGVIKIVWIVSVSVLLLIVMRWTNFAAYTEQWKKLDFPLLYNQGATSSPKPSTFSTRKTKSSTPATAAPVFIEQHSGNVKIDSKLNAASPGSSLKIIYNRVPKCGSAAVQRVIKQLHVVNNFTFLSSSILREEHIGHAEQKEFVHFISGLPAPAVFDRHLHFIDYSRFAEPWPVYINVIRDPLERRLSLYYFKLNGRNNDGGRLGESEYRNLTFDQCLKLGPNSTLSRPCPYPLHWNNVLPYFCGHDDICRARDRQTLALAKSNVEKHYSVVGLQEELTSFFRVLEIKFPRIFRGAVDVYTNTSSTMYGELASSKKILPSSKTAELVTKLESLDYEFYRFIKKRFNEQKTSILQTVVKS